MLPRVLRRLGGAPRSAPESAQCGAFSGPVLRDTARLSQRYTPIARFGGFGVSTWPLGCDTPSPFSERFPLGEHAKWRCDTPPPPPPKGVSQRYFRDTLCKQGKWVRQPPSAILSRKGIARYGGVSRTGPLRALTGRALSGALLGAPPQSPRALSGAPPGAPRFPAAPSRALPRALPRISHFSSPVTGC